MMKLTYVEPNDYFPKEIREKYFPELCLEEDQDAEKVDRPEEAAQAEEKKG